MLIGRVYYIIENYVVAFCWPHPSRLNPEEIDASCSTTIINILGLLYYREFIYMPKYIWN